jgi:hypothetical protein
VPLSNNENDTKEYYYTILYFTAETPSAPFYFYEKSNKIATVQTDSFDFKSGSWYLVVLCIN